MKHSLRYETLGHKSIKNTLIYIDLEHTLYQPGTDEFTVRAAKTVEEVGQLIEVGFEYVYEKDGLMFFRKRK